jgi:hypothetical protein
LCGDRIGFVHAHRLAGDNGQVDRVAAAESLLSLGQREQRVDQLLLLLVLLERIATRIAERVGGGRGIGHDHLEQRAGGGQRRAQLVRGVGHEPSLRVIGPLERPQHSPGHQPAQAPRDQRHDGQRDRRLDLEVVQIGASLPAAEVSDRGLTAGRLQGPLNVRRHLRPRCRRVDHGIEPSGSCRGSGDVLTQHRDLRTGFQSLGRARDERVGDRQERGAAGQEQAAVEQREPPPDGGLGMAQPIDPAHRPSPIRVTGRPRSGSRRGSRSGSRAGRPACRAAGSRSSAPRW